MFRFSVDRKSAERVNQKQLASHAVGRDDDWEEGLRDTGDYRNAEAYFRADTTSPDSVEEAISYVQGLFFTTPERVWIGDDLFEIDQEMTERAQKSTS